MASASRGAAETTRAPPTTGPTAMSTPTSSSSLAPAARASSTAPRQDAVVAPTESSAPRRTSEPVLASSAGAPGAPTAGAVALLTAPSSLSASRRRSSSRCIVGSTLGMLATAAHRPYGMTLADRGSGVDEPDGSRLGDGLGARRHVELAVDRVRLCLDGVRRHVQPRRDLAEGEVAGQEAQHTQLRGGQRPVAADLLR